MSMGRDLRCQMCRKPVHCLAVCKEQGCRALVCGDCKGEHLTLFHGWRKRAITSGSRAKGKAA